VNLGTIIGFLLGLLAAYFVAKMRGK